MQEYWTKHKPIYKLSSNDHSPSLKSFCHKKYVSHDKHLVHIKHFNSKNIRRNIFHSLKTWLVVPMHPIVINLKSSRDYR